MARFIYRTLSSCVSVSIRLSIGLWTDVRTLSSRSLVLRRTGWFNVVPENDPRRRIWVQAVSVGEATLGRRFAANLLERFPDDIVVLTSSTPTGQRLLDGVSADRLYTGPFPFDDARSVRRALDAYRPSALVLLETELWPTLIEETARRDVPIIVLNGRMSANSERYYARFRSFMRETLDGVNLYCVQSHETADRLCRLGVSADKIAVTGSMKYDAAIPHVSETETAELRDELGLGERGLKIVVAGSTRSGEEDVLLTAFDELVRNVKGLHLIVAPRHTNRVDEVKRIIERHGITWRSRKEPGTGDPNAPILILDTMGELNKVYACADVAFVGGALFPGPGGHNPLEPAALGIPVLFGPHMDNCRDSAGMLESAGGAWTVSTADELAETIRRLLTDETLRNDAGRRAAQTAREGQGAMTRNIDMLERILGAAKSIPS